MGRPKGSKNGIVKRRSSGIYVYYKFMVVQETWKKLKNTPLIKDNKISHLEFKRIIATLSWGIMEEVLINPQGFIIPCNLGYFQVIGIKKQSAPSERSMFLYAITDNYHYTIRHYFKNQKKTKNQEFYTFRISSNAKKLISRRIKTDDFFHYYKFKTRKEFRKTLKYI